MLPTSDAIVAGLDEAQIDAALAGHPRIGERAAGLDEESAARSAKEQSAMSRPTPTSRRPSTAATPTTRSSFGRIYLVAAAGRSAEELLGLLHQRLGNDPVTELDVVRGELARISRMRLTTELHEQPEDR